ncbi:MAG: type II secretion system protein [Candidatus Paceibacterota bacterium]
MKRTQSRAKGFTLLEILLVVGIISILAGIVILAINPTRQLGDTRNAQRRSDVLTILNAIYQYSIDNPGGIDTIVSLTDPIYASSDCGAANATDALLLEDALVGAGATYLTAIPTDPTATDPTTEAEYYLSQDATTHRITVCAPNSVGEGNIPSGGDQIEVTR